MRVLGADSWHWSLKLVLPSSGELGQESPHYLSKHLPRPHPQGTLEQAFAERTEEGEAGLGSLLALLQHCKCLCNPEGVFFPHGPISYQSCPLPVTRSIPCLKKKWRDLKYLHLSFQQPLWLCENSGSQKLKQKCFVKYMYREICVKSL